ncbi:hypothetical protein JMJ55_25450 [Belnapia sp. T6]|uniref:Uncharacterized protein n=1 Tax=Belnapia mucosa TaxID=2804532 RepID=A0ABS1VAI9_9PROT|nr:hypothetical protein [Belnapia mucosa]MBL6458687.1 hypothetical protein [Belnapia mucosa]
MAIDQSAYTFNPITLPGIGVVPQLADINNHGDIVGHIDDASGEHGFLLRGGDVTILDVPGANGTVATSVNDAGDIVGYYLSPDIALHGFLYSHGTFTTLDIPGASSTELTGINDRGQIVGFASASSADAPSGGFIFDNGAFTRITVPDHPDAFLVPQGINNHGVIVGVSGNEGFVLEGDHLTTLDNPFSSFFIRPDDVNDEGQVVGSLAPAQRAGAGFVYDDSQITLFGPPQPTNQAPNWSLHGINDAGDIVGNNGSGGASGGFAFLATPTAVTPPAPNRPVVDWDALAALVEANFAATGKWFVPDDVSVPAPIQPVVDWDAIAAQVEANFAATGQWFL